MAKLTIVGIASVVAAAAVALVLSAPPLYTFAQDGPPPRMGPAMDAAARANAKARAYSGLSADHRAQVEGIVADLAAKKTTDIRAAGERIDGILSDAEKQNVLAAWQAMRGSMQHRAPEGAPPGDAPPGGMPPNGAPPSGAPPNGMRGGGRGPESAGAILIRMSLTREQMQALRPAGAGRPPQ